MTVASLWKALDRAGSGQHVGSRELQQHFRLKQHTTPWNVNESNKLGRPTLAVDLSIWICEALTSSAMASNHADPPLHLVYTRTLKLLNLGVKLVIVIEGKRRTRKSDGNETLRKRRSGTRFWNACQRCEKMLQLIGVPVVRARAEGEALCALLNQEGVVDGVISNDGDCLLYGAKVLYTKFSLENLEKSKVVRYDINDLRVCVDDDDSDTYDRIGGAPMKEGVCEVVSLTRSDLITFAILTGSDVVGEGLPKVGCRKAIRFIRKCQMDNPMKTEEASITELKSWAKAASRQVESSITNGEESKVQRCSCCCHPGSKASHKKNGCQVCGTEPGEPCFFVSPGGRFRSSLRKKALEMTAKFDPESVIAVYSRPNDNQVPLTLHGEKSVTLQMAYPSFQELLQSSLIIRGHTLLESREYLQQSMSRLLARTELLNEVMQNNGEGKEYPQRLPPVNKTRPQPVKIQKAIVCHGQPSFEVAWLTKASVTDSEGNPMNEFEFTTIEDQSMVKKCYPSLFAKFEEEEKEQRRQGSAEQEKRRAFLDNMYGVANRKTVEERTTKPKEKLHKSLARHFKDDNGTSRNTHGRKEKPQEKTLENLEGLEIIVSTERTSGWSASLRRIQNNVGQNSAGDDVTKLLQFLNGKGKMKVNDDDLSSLCSEIVRNRYDDVDHLQGLTPGHIHYLGFNRSFEMTSRVPKHASFETELNEPFLVPEYSTDHPSSVYSPLRVGDNRAYTNFLTRESFENLDRPGKESFFSEGLGKSFQKRSLCDMSPQPQHDRTFKRRMVAEKTDFPQDIFGGLSCADMVEQQSFSKLFKPLKLNNDSPGVFQNATQKLEAKIRQAQLNFECVKRIGDFRREYEQ